MMRNIKYTMLTLLLLITASSCNKWLELKPDNGLVKENFWGTKEQLKSAVVGIYTSMNSALIQNLFIWGELRADMATVTSFATANEIDLNNDQIVSTNALTNWATLYNTINYCNTVIDNAPSVLAKDNTLSQIQYNSYIAEAKAIRGLMYFYLLRIWGEVPLQLSASSSDSNIKQLAKSSKDDVYAQIKADLDFAAINAVNTYGDQNSDKGRITKYAVYAMQADVALWQEKYDECIAACDNIINSNKFGLIDGSNVSTWYATLYLNGNSNESIFEDQFDTQFLNPFYNLMATATKRYSAIPLISDFFGVDPLNPALADIRGDNASYRSSDGVIWKQVGTGNSGTTVAAANSTRHWFFYRYADVLLMKAEALAWTGKGTEALDLVNTVRARAGALSVTAEFPSASSAVAVSDYILRERSREFAFEGKRWFDLIRHSKRKNYAHIDLLLSALIKVAPIDKQKSILDKSSDPRSHYLPIIQSELTADKLLVQNPFYQ